MDGEETPSIDMQLYMGHGIGFNDNHAPWATKHIVLGTYYFNTGKFHADIAGLTHFDKKENSFSAYRFHDDDPIFFQDGLRLTCRCGETEHGLAGETKGYLNPLETRYTTYTWVYQW